MTRRARSLVVARLAQVRRRRRTCAVIATPIPVVREVARWKFGAGLEVLVAGIARACVALAVMTLEARGHDGTQPIIAFGDTDVAAHAVALRPPEVLTVIEAEMSTRFEELLARCRSRVACQARIRVVRLGVTADAGRIVGEVQHTILCRGSFDPGVAPGAGHAAQ